MFRLLLALTFPCAVVHSLNNGVGLTPPMGYSSWNDCASEVTEERIKNITTHLISTGLAAKGFVQVNVDGPDHLVHRHTHRVVRGALLAVGRPDGRMHSLASAEAATLLSVKQVSSTQSLGVIYLCAASV